MAELCTLNFGAAAYTAAMSEPTEPRLNKLPFLAGDLFLLAVAAWLVWRPGPPLDLWHKEKPSDSHTASTSGDFWV